MTSSRKSPDEFLPELVGLDYSYRNIQENQVEADLAQESSVSLPGILFYNYGSTKQQLANEMNYSHAGILSLSIMCLSTEKRTLS